LPYSLKLSQSVAHQLVLFLKSSQLEQQQFNLILCVESINLALVEQLVRFLQLALQHAQLAHQFLVLHLHLAKLMLALCNQTMVQLGRCTPVLLLLLAASQFLG
jgi:hypothetical protein